MSDTHTENLAAALKAKKKLAKLSANLTASLEKAKNKHVSATAAVLTSLSSEVAELVKGSK